MSEGWCSLCKSPYVAAINTLIKQGKNAGEAARAMAAFDVKFDRHTFYKHKPHIEDPMTTAVERARETALAEGVPKSTRAVLERIRDLGMANALNNPEEVTVDHALKAASELNKQESKGEGVLIILAKAAMGVAQVESPAYIDGEYTDVAPRLLESDETDTSEDE
jgi:hypothetical protein